MGKRAMPQCGLPKRILKHATPKELEDAYELVDKVRYRWHTDRADPFFELRKRAAWEASWGLRGFRARLRKRYAEAMSEGVYRTTASYTPFKNEMCKYGTRHAGILPKGSILTWTHRDELGQNWFMWMNRIITIAGTPLDRVERLE
jgi:hypothetical protein